MLRWFFSLMIGFSSLLGQAPVVAAELDIIRIPTESRSSSSRLASRPATRPASQPATKERVWLKSVAAGTVAAQPAGRPILVRFGADWCGWCRKLDAEIAKPAVQSELERWIGVYIDVDSPQDAQDVKSLGVGPIPALRILTPAGRLVASQDGYMTADALLAWLQQQHEQASTIPTAELTSTGPPTAEVVARLVKEFGSREPAVREAAVRRLTNYPSESATAVVDAFTKDRLAVRLAANELLTSWKAPVREMDPWRPETFTDERLKAIREWAAAPNKQLTSRPAELTGDELANARRDLADLVRARNAAEAQAIRERLARIGAALLPEIYARLKTVEDDQSRERLTALRYRLTAGDDLALRWPSGFERLASMDADTRQRAAEELGRFAGTADVSMLLELFSSPDALVREISLRLLNEMGGAQTTDAMVRLLGDPEPNVRAAVLKQWAEKPSPSLVPKIAAYVAGETDPDLIVHAVRALRAAKTTAAADCLMNLLKNPVWQVRAEAAEALGECIESSEGISSEKKADAYVALIGLLEDRDGFVVSRAVTGLQRADLPAAVEPLVKAASAHPELAADIVSMLAGSEGLRSKAIVHLRSFCTHAEAAVRAAAIAGLGTAAPDDIEKEMLATLADRDGKVRIAAANVLFGIIDANCSSSRRMTYSVHTTYESPSLMGWLFGSKKAKKSAASKASETQPATTHPSATRPGGSQPVSTRPAIEDPPWLIEWRSGKKRPQWMATSIPLLEKMLASQQADERVAACRPLVALGREDAVLPILLTDARASASSYARTVAVLPWLPGEKRRQFLDQMLRMNPGGDGLTALVSAIAESADENAADPLWTLLASPSANIDVGGQVLIALTKVYFGDDNYDPPAIPIAKRRHVTAIVKEKVAAGPPMQRLIALALLLGTSPDDAAEVATKMFQGTSFPENIRADAFQILLLSQQGKNGQDLAVANIAHPLVEVRRLALAYLSQGKNALLYMRNRIWLYSAVRTGFFEEVSGSGDKVDLQPPKRVTAEVLRPMLADSDPKSAAYAGYLLSLFGEKEGLAPLVTYWRTNAISDESWTRLVYRAAAAMNSEEQVPLLEEIYGRFKKDDYSVREFYWTIRVMTGPKILKLRAKVRSEVGMDRLR